MAVQEFRIRQGALAITPSGARVLVLLEDGKYCLWIPTSEYVRVCGSLEDGLPKKTPSIYEIWYHIKILNFRGAWKYILERFGIASVGS